MTPTIRFVPTQCNLYCTGGPNMDDSHFATRQLLLDGEFDGDATCDDEQHCAGAIELALEDFGNRMIWEGSS